MTKRFIGNFQGKMLVSIKDTEKDCNVNILQIVEIANILVDENKQLKSDVYDWKASAEDYLKLGKSLKEENEQLKKQLKDCQIKFRKFNNHIVGEL